MRTLGAAKIQWAYVDFLVEYLFHSFFVVFRSRLHIETCEEDESR